MSSPAYEFSSDEEIAAFNHEDKSMEITGYVDMIDGKKTLKTSQGHVLKFVLNNGSKSRIRILIWGTAQVLKYEPLIRLNEIVEITGGTLRESNPLFRNLGETICPLEFHVQTYSVIIFHGEYKGSILEPSVSFASVKFDEVMLTDGPIEVSGYIKSDGFCLVKAKNSSYDQGTIVDGHYRLVVQIASFEEDKRMQKGVHVLLRGVMNKNNGGGLKVADMNAIDVLEDDIMSADDLKKSIHNVMMVKTKRPLEESHSNDGDHKRLTGNEKKICSAITT